MILKVKYKRQYTFKAIEFTKNNVEETLKFLSVNFTKEAIKALKECGSFSLKSSKIRISKEDYTEIVIIYGCFIVLNLEERTINTYSKEEFDKHFNIIEEE